MRISTSERYRGEDLARAIGRAILTIVVGALKVVRYALFGVLALLEPVFLWLLSAAVLVLSVMCVFYALVRPAHFPFGLALGLIALCGLVAVGFYAFMRWLLPRGP